MDRFRSIGSLFVTLISVLGCNTVDELKVAEDFTYNQLIQSEMALLPLIDNRPNNRPDTSSLDPDMKEKIAQQIWNESEKRFIVDRLSSSIMEERKPVKAIFVDSGVANEFKFFVFEGSISKDMLDWLKKAFTGRYIGFVILRSHL